MVKDRSKVLRWTGHLIAIGGFCFVLFKVVHNFSGFPSLHVTVVTLGAFFIATLYFILVNFIGTVGWNKLLEGVEPSLSLRRTYVIMGKSQIGKYLPSNIFHYVGRIALARDAGISSEWVVMTIGLETVLLVLAAALVCSAEVFTNVHQLPIIYLHFMRSKGLAVAISLALIIAVSILVLIPKARNWIKRYLSYVNPGKIITVLSLYALVYIFSGVIILLMVQEGLGLHSDVSWYQYSSGYALAWLLGFIVPGVPGGIGIREAVFVELFSPALGEGEAAGVAILFRIITTLSDVVTFAAAWILEKSDPSSV